MRWPSLENATSLTTFASRVNSAIRAPVCAAQMRAARQG
jgi:hypothetical protein